jgi:hypothetical protein
MPGTASQILTSKRLLKLLLRQLADLAESYPQPFGSALTAMGRSLLIYLWGILYNLFNCQTKQYRLLEISNLKAEGRKFGGFKDLLSFAFNLT